MKRTWKHPSGVTNPWGRGARERRYKLASWMRAGSDEDKKGAVRKRNSTCEDLGTERTSAFKEKKKNLEVIRGQVILKPLKDFKQENDAANFMY